jgi:hypothetical protein
MASRREERVTEAATGGALGGALVGYLGVGPLDTGVLLDKLLIGAGIGTVAGLVVLLFSIFVAKDGWRDVLGRSWWLVPGCAGLVALIMGYRELLDWAFGWALAGWASGWQAALLGGVVGGVLFGGFAVLATRPRRDPASRTHESAPGPGSGTS